VLNVWKFKTPKIENSTWDLGAASCRLYHIQIAHTRNLSKLQKINCKKGRFKGRFIKRRSQGTFALATTWAPLNWGLLLQRQTREPYNLKHNYELDACLCFRSSHKMHSSHCDSKALSVASRNARSRRRAAGCRTTHTTGTITGNATSCTTPSKTEVCKSNRKSLSQQIAATRPWADSFTWSCSFLKSVKTPE